MHEVLAECLFDTIEKVKNSRDMMPSQSQYERSNMALGGFTSYVLIPPNSVPFDTTLSEP
jgi:hypothetical protein